LALIILGGGVWGGVALFGKRFGKGNAELVLFKVKYDRLPLTVVEKGTLESKKNNDIKCTVKARTPGSQTSTTIRWLVDDGTHVSDHRDMKEVALIYKWNEDAVRYDEIKGPDPNGVKVIEVSDGNGGTKLAELVVELDDSGHQDTLKTQAIDVNKAESDKIQAEEKYRSDVIQNEADIAAAENTLKINQLDLKKYTEGDYPASLKVTLGNIKVGESDVEQQRERVAWMQRMVKRGYQTQSTLQAEQSKLESMELTLAKYHEDHRVLTLYTKEKEETDRRQKVNDAALALKRIKIQATAKEAQSKIDRDAKTKVYNQQVDRYQDLKGEIKKCKLCAPQDGMVVYFVDERTRWGQGRQALIAQGETVTEGQTLMRIPDLKRMAIDTRVHEALISRVKTAQLAAIKTDAYPDRILKGKVDQVATVAAAADWMSSDVKVYQTKVAIDEYLEGLKPGMSAEVTITTGSPREHVLVVPVEAIIGGAELAGKRELYVMGDKGPELRPVVIGDSNDKMVEIKDGVVEGDEVVLNPKALLGDIKIKTREPGSGRSGEEGSKAGDAAKGTPKAGGPGGPGVGTGGAGGVPGGPGGMNKGGPGGPGAGQGGAGGGKAGGFKGPTAEQKKQFQDNLEKLKKAKPEERKKLLEQFYPDEQVRGFVKEAFKSQGVDIPD
jgi:multidrug resistance efflux pump